VQDKIPLIEIEMWACRRNLLYPVGCVWDFGANPFCSISFLITLISELLLWSN